MTLKIPLVLQHDVIQCLKSKLQLANQHLTQEYPEPQIRYQQRGTYAGTAHLTTWEIHLNPVLLLENQHAFIEQVIPHELAHLLVFQRFGKVPPHGKEWRWMMEAVLQVPAKRTHSFSVSSISQTFPYYCCCQQHQLTLRRHHRILRKQSHYQCRQCGETLQPGFFSLKQ